MMKSSTVSSAPFLIMNRALSRSNQVAEIVALAAWCYAFAPADGVGAIGVIYQCQRLGNRYV